MNRLVFQLAGAVGPDNQRHVEISLEEPSVFGADRRPFVCTAQEPEFLALKDAQLTVDAIRIAGRRLYDALVTHPELSQWLTTALQTQAPQRYPIYVEIATGAGIEVLPWETLCAPNGEFLGLDERWALGRIVDGPSPVQSTWPFASPLRVAAVLSCLGVPARDEWLALSDAFAAAALDVEVLVVVSEEALFEEIQPAAPANVRVEFVPPDLTNLQQMVRAFRPHVLHFFCHGSAQTSPHLRIAVKSDWLLGGQSSITVEPREIREFTERTDDRPWLVVLNCCESAAAVGAEDVQSIALRLVVDGAVPAVVGMREPVRSNDANLFTRAFYGRLLGELGTRTTAAAPDTEPIDWAQLVVQARTELARKHPGLIFSQAAASTKEWTMPVVYMRPTPFTLRVPPAAAAPPAAPPAPPGPPGGAPTPRALRLQIEALRGMLAQLPPDDPSQALREDIERQLAALTQQPEPP